MSFKLQEGFYYEISVQEVLTVTDKSLTLNEKNGKVEATGMN